ncbi:MAG TPA: WD40 repeat domain-containing protein [Anaerolineales bacterium]|nr:WD40 repeat domain-containing protein [Anaerolineales bacterium]
MRIRDVRVLWQGSLLLMSVLLVACEAPGAVSTPTVVATLALLPATPTESPARTPSPTTTITPTPLPGLQIARLGRGRANDVAYSPDGGTLAVAGSLGVWLFDPQDGEPIHLFETTGDVWCAAWSPDGERLAGGMHDGRVVIWNVAERRELARFLAKGSIQSLAWSPSGDALLSGDSAGVVSVWDVAGLRPTAELEGHFLQEGGVSAVAWSPDGRRIAAGGVSPTLKVWEADGLREVMDLNVSFMSNQVGPAVWTQSVSWSPRGDLLVARTMDGVVWLWDATTGALVRKLEKPSGYPKAFWSPDGGRLALLLQDGVQLLEPGAWQEIGRLRNRGYITGLAWSPEGQHLATVQRGSEDVVQIWELGRGQVERALTGFTGSAYGAIWSADGARIVVGYSNGVLRLWDLSSGEPVSQLDGVNAQIVDFDWSSASELVAVAAGDGRVRLWNPLSGRIERTLSEEGVDELAWAPGGPRLATSGLYRAERVWDGRTGKRSWYVPEETTVGWLRRRGLTLAWSQDGSWLLAGEPAGTLRIWEGATGRLVWTVPLTAPGDLAAAERQVAAWLPGGGSLLVGDASGSLTVWDIQLRKLLLTLSCHLSVGEVLSAIAWSPSGATVACLDSQGVVHAVDTQTGEERFQIALASGWEAGLMWAPDGEMLALWNGAGELQIVEGSTGALLLAGQGQADVLGKTWCWAYACGPAFGGVAWSPDGSRLATAGADGTLRIWGLGP